MIVSVAGGPITTVPSTMGSTQCAQSHPSTESASSEIDLSLADYSFVGDNGSDYTGWSVSSAGDVDGDGFADVLVGAMGNSDGSCEAGRAYLTLGHL